MFRTDLKKVDFVNVPLDAAMDLPPCDGSDGEVVVHVEGRPQRWMSRTVCAAFYDTLAMFCGDGGMAERCRKVSALCRDGATIPSDGVPPKVGADCRLEHRFEIGKTYAAYVANGDGLFHGKVVVKRETVPNDIFGFRVFLCDLMVEESDMDGVNCVYPNVEFFAEPPSLLEADPYPDDEADLQSSEVLRNADMTDFTARAYACQCV